MPEPVCDPVGEFEKTLTPPTTPEAAQAVIAAAEANPTFALWSQPSEARRALYQLAYGQTPVFLGDGTVPIGPNTEPVSSPPVTGEAKTQAEARAVLEAADHDPNHPLWSKPLAERTKLFQFAYGEPGQVAGQLSPGATAPQAVTMPTLADGEEWDPAFTETIQQDTRDLGLDPGKMGAVIAYALSLRGKDALTSEEAAERGKSRWGAEQLAHKVKIAAYLAAQLSPGIGTLQDDPVLGNDLDLIDRLADLGRPLWEAHVAAERRTHDPKDAYNLPGHPDHQQALEEILALERRAGGGRKLNLAEL